MMYDVCQEPVDTFMKRGKCKKKLHGIYKGWTLSNIVYAQIHSQCMELSICLDVFSYIEIDKLSRNDFILHFESLGYSYFNVSGALYIYTVDVAWKH